MGSERNYTSSKSLNRTRYRLGELVSFSSGGTPSKSEPQYWNGNIPWVSAKTMKTERVSSSDLRITYEGLINGSRLAPANSILLLVRGSELFNRIPCCIVTKPVAFNQDVKCLESKTRLQIRFVYYWLLSQSSIISQMVESTGIGAGKLDLKRLQNLELEIPSDEMVNFIIGIADDLSDKIELNNRIIANLEAQAQAIFKSWFLDFEPFLDGEFEETELGLIPKGWSIFTFSDILTPSSEKDNSSDIPEYSVTNTGIYTRDEKYKKKLSMTNSANKIIRKGDLVFGMSRTILNWGIMHDEIGGVSSAYHVFKVDEHIPPKYLEGYIRSYISYFGDIIKPAAREGQGIDKSALYAKQIYLPREQVINEYYSTEDAIIISIENFRQQNEALEQTRDTLLPKLMSGEIRV